MKQPIGNVPKWTQIENETSLITYKHTQAPQHYTPRLHSKHRQGQMVPPSTATLCQLATSLVGFVLRRIGRNGWLPYPIDHHRLGVAHHQLDHPPSCMFWPASALDDMPPHLTRSFFALLPSASCSSPPPACRITSCLCHIFHRLSPLSLLGEDLRSHLAI